MNDTNFRILQPGNAKVLVFLHLRRMEYTYLFPQKESPVFTSWNSGPDAYCDCACHPDVVDYLWNQAGGNLPMDCRGFVHGSPVLVHPASGIIFGICAGTLCFLRLPEELYLEALKTGAKTYVEVKPTGNIDVNEDLGEGWILSPSDARKPDWFKRIYEACGG